MDMIRRKDIFFSYSHADREIVEPIAEQMQAEYSCWLDTDHLRKNEKEDVVDERIAAAIQECTVFLLFASKAYLTSKYCTLEFSLAHKLEKSIVPVCLDDADEDTSEKAAEIFRLLGGICGRSRPYGYHDGIQKGDYVSRYAEAICSTEPMQLAKRGILPAVHTNDFMIRNSEYMLQNLSVFNQNRFNEKGNYYHGNAENGFRMSQYLYAPLTDPERDQVYYGNADQMPLEQYLEENMPGREEPWTFIAGEGGIGKSVSLQECCRYLLNRNIYAIYIPLSKLNLSKDGETNAVEEYIRKQSVSSQGILWADDLLLRMKNPAGAETPVYLVLDGLNEMINPVLFVKRDLSHFSRAYKNVQVIMSSRSYDRNAMAGIDRKFRILQLDVLRTENVQDYLKSVYPDRLPDPQTLCALNTPLLATLYAETDMHSSKYEEFPWIHLENPADSAGKILWNYLQSQLYRAAREENFDLSQHMLVLDFLLPAIAFHMLQNGSEEDPNSIEEDELRYELCEDLFDSRRNFKLKIYRDGTLEPRTGSPQLPEPEQLIPLAYRSLNLLCYQKESSTYSFLHPVFRDFFAALYIANELQMLKEHRILYKKMDSFLIEQMQLPEEILRYISDLTHEEKARPCRRETGLIYPGKSGREASSFSLAETMLACYRHKEGEAAQNAVHNLLGVMKTGRKDNLSFCDFSGLDLRSCRMNGVLFSDFHDHEVYASCFDEAWINPGFFSLEGHRAKITALCIDQNGAVWSGDESGNIRCSTSAEFYRYQNEPIRALAADPEHSRLLVVYASVICSLDYLNYEFQVVEQSRYWHRAYKYIQLREHGKVTFSWTSDPLCFYGPDGRKTEESIPGICAGHAAISPDRRQYAFSLPSQNLAIRKYNPETERFEPHPAILHRFEDPRYQITLQDTADHLVCKAEVVLRDGRKIADCSIRMVTGERGSFISVFIPMRDPAAAALGKAELNYLKELLRAKYRFRFGMEPNMPLRLERCGIAEASNISALFYSPDSRILFLCAGRYLAALDAETLEPLNVHKASSAIRCAACDGKQIVYACGTEIKVLSMDFILRQEIPGWPLSDLNYVLLSPSGEEIYAVCGKDIVRLNMEMQVTGRRKKPCSERFQWARDRRSKKLQMVFGYHSSTRYDFAADCDEPLGWCYEILTAPRINHMDKQGDRLLAIDPETGISHEYIGLRGIFIADCSFRKIQIDSDLLKEEQYRDILQQNGGRMK